MKHSSDNTTQLLNCVGKVISANLVEVKLKTGCKGWKQYPLTPEAVNQKLTID